MNMASLSTAALLVLAVSTSLAFPQRPMASYHSQMTSSHQQPQAPVGYYLVPMHGGGRMGSFPQFGSPYGMQQPQIVYLHPGSFAQQFNNPAQNRMDGQNPEPTNVEPKPGSGKDAQQDTQQDAQQDTTDTQSVSGAPPQQTASSVGNPSNGPMYVVLGQMPQMGYYDLMDQSYMQQMAASNYLPQEPTSRTDHGQRVNFVPFRPASRYRSHAMPTSGRSQKPTVGLSYAYPNLFTRQQSYDDGEGYDQDDGVVIEATGVRHAAEKAEKGERVDSEKVDAAAPAGPSVAQAKPQAIAMAGPGGVAAATPMATAVVGPGGMAVAAPSATAVAGPSGGKPPISLGNNAALTAAYKAQMKAERKQDQYSAVSLGGRLVSPISAGQQNDGMYAF